MKSQFLLYATLIAGMVMSCSEEALVEVNNSNKSSITTIEATIVDTDAQTTKTVRKSDGKIYWNPGDDINVFFGSDKGKFTSSNTEDAATASFNGSILISSVVGMNEGDEGSAFIWGLYPYNENATFDGTYVHTSLTNMQTGKAGSFADDLYITLAKEKGFLLSFYNVLSGIKFSVQQEGIKQITFSGNDNETLAGNLKLKFGNDNRPVVSEITNGKTSITLSPDGESFAVGEYYYIVFAPTTFSKGFSLTFTKEDKEGTYTYSNNISFPRNKFGTLANADKAVEYCRTKPSSNEILYTTASGNVINPYIYAGVFGMANITSNTYEDEIGVITFDCPISQIGALAFEKCTDLTSVTLPDNVSSIGYSAFAGCTSMENIKIGYGVTSMDKDAFTGCTGNLYVNSPIPNSGFYNAAFETVTIGPGVTTFGTDAFSHCGKLRRVTLEEGAKVIGGTAFWYCPNLKRIDLPSTIEAIGYNILYESNGVAPEIHITDLETWCNMSHGGVPMDNQSYYGYRYSLYIDEEKINDLVIPNTITDIPSNAFSGCSIGSVTIPSSVTTIGACAFNRCPLKSVSIPGNVESIGNYAFSQCSELRSVTIENGVEEIGYYAFGRCNTLIRIFCNSTVPPIGNSDMFYAASSNLQISVPSESVDTYKAASYWNSYASYITGPTIPATSLILSNNKITLYEGKYQRLYATVTPNNTTDLPVIWKSSNTSIATVSTSGWVTAIKAGTVNITANAGLLTETCTVTVKSPYEAVDLGLSVDWCSCNLGGYVYDEAIYNWVDNNTYAWTESDPVVSTLGNGWRMPTKAEWEELVEKCDITFSSHNYDGMMIVTSRINGNKIYLAPNIPGDQDNYGSGSYWVTKSSDKYYIFGFSSSYDDEDGWEHHHGIYSSIDYGNCGSHLIRPVRDK